MKTDLTWLEQRIREGSRLAESRLVVEIPRGVPLGMTSSALSSARKMSYTPSRSVQFRIEFVMTGLNMADHVMGLNGSDLQACAFGEQLAAFPDV